MSSVVTRSLTRTESASAGSGPAHRERAGVVERGGVGVKDFKPGDRVAYGSGAPGAYADLRNMPADRLIAIPQGISEGKRRPF